MVGFLLQWPTIPMSVMFPVLVVFYRRLAVSEEKDVRERFGSDWIKYAASTPRFLPKRNASRMTSPGLLRRALFLRSGHDDV